MSTLIRIITLHPSVLEPGRRAMLIGQRCRPAAPQRASIMAREHKMLPALMKGSQLNPAPDCGLFLRRMQFSLRMASLITEGESRTERRLICFRASMLLAFILAAVFVPAKTAFSNSESPANQQTGVAAFGAVRHSDTIETRTPYQVAVRQLSGPHTVGGYIEYSVWNSRGKQSGSERVKLAKSNSKAGEAEEAGRCKDRRRPRCGLENGNAGCGAYHR